VPSKNIEAFLAFLRNAESEYRIAEANEKSANDATQDILHAIEFNTYNPRKTAHLVKKIHAVRQERRDAKETMEIFSHILAWSAENKNVVKSLERLLGAVRKTENRIEKRTYSPRTSIMDET